MEKKNLIHPDYYGGDSKYEATKVINHYNLNFNLGNVVKYILRAGKKHRDTKLEDLKKAKNYIDFEITRLEEDSERIRQSERSI